MNCAEGVAEQELYLKNTVIIVTDWHEALKTLAFSGDGFSRGDALIVIKMINKKSPTASTGGASYAFTEREPCHLAIKQQGIFLMFNLNSRRRHN